MKSIQKLILFLCVTVFTVGCNSQTEKSIKKEEKYKLNIDEAKKYLNDIEKLGFSGQVFLKTKDGVFNQGYGFSNRKSNISNDENTVFDIGSLAKYYTKAAIIKNIEQGKLNLNETLGDIFNDTPIDKKGITVQQLLNMTSGIVEYVPGTKEDFDAISKEKARKRIFKSKLLFEPGKGNEYSNAGYTLLAMIIEEKSRMSYPDFLQKYIFIKGIEKHGFYKEKFWDEAQVAHGYDGVKLFDNNSPYHWPKISWTLMGAGGIVTSAKGLNEWLVAVNNEKIFDKTHTKLFNELTVRVPTSRGTKALVRVGGGDYGFSSAIADYPEEGFFVAINSNTAKFDVPRKVLSGFLKTILPLNKKNQVDEKSAKKVEEKGNSPKEKRLKEFLTVLKSGDLKEYVKNTFSTPFLNDFGIEQHVGLLNSMREKHGTFAFIETLESRQGYLKILVKSEKTDEQRVLILEFVTQPPFKIDALGIELPKESSSESSKISNENFTPAEKRFHELVNAINGDDDKLKEFISNNFETNFLNDHGGVEGHFKFMKEDFSGGIEILDVLDVDTTFGVFLMENRNTNERFKATINVDNKSYKIQSLLFD